MKRSPDVTFTRVARITFLRGEGVSPDPIREVTAYYDVETGEFLFELDPVADERPLDAAKTRIKPVPA